MAEEMTQEQMLEEQKKQCIFCKIIAGEMESKKIYEDDHFVAMLDIRPAIEGHVLLMPKEHVPILPLLPADHMQELFKLIRTLGMTIKEARAAQSVTVFAANGAVAGQQAPHMLVHLIPRDPGDGLDVLDLHQRTVQQADTIALQGTFEQATKQVVQQLGRGDILEQSESAPATEDKISPVPATFEEVEEEVPDQQVEQAPPPDAKEEVQEFEGTNDALEAALEQNPELKRMIIAEPSLVEEYVAKSENLKQLFAGVNIKALSMALRRQEGEAEQVAKAMTDEELFAFIDGNEGLRTWLLTHPEELAKNIGQNPKLQRFFEGVSIEELAQKYKLHRGDS